MYQGAFVFLLFMAISMPALPSTTMGQSHASITMGLAIRMLALQYYIWCPLSFDVL